MKFDWQTDEDGPLVPESVETRRDTAPRYRWLIWLTFPAVLLLTGFAVYTQLNRRVDAAHAEIEADVLAAFNLAQQALTQGDAELLATVLYREDVQWFREWGEVAENGRYPLPIPPLLTPHDELDITAVNLSSELDKAEIVWRRPYTLYTGSAPEQIVYLQHAHFYEKTAIGWLWRPPDNESWGEWHTEIGQYLNLTYSESDEAFALPLAQELDALLTGWCEGELPAGIHCPTRPPWTVRLNRNPASLDRSNQTPTIPPSSASHLPMPPLPTITLLGEPVDEAGVTALRRYYALQIGAALIQFSRYRSSPNQFSPTELMTWLTDMGLMVWPPHYAPPPHDMPGGLTVHCGGDGGGTLWQYETAAGWRPLLPDQSFYEIMPWPGGGLFLGSRQELDDGLQVTFSRYLDGRLMTIHQFQPANPSPNQHPFQYGGLYPGLLFSSALPILFVIDQDENNWTPYMADCDDNDCALIEIGGGDPWRITIWSVDGRYGLVYLDNDSVQVVDQTDAAIRELPSAGIGSVKWLDNERFLNIPPPEPGGPYVTENLIIGYAAGDQPDRVIAVADLLDEEERAVSLHLEMSPFSMHSPRNQVILIGQSRGSTTVTGRPGMQLFSFELDGAEPKLKRLPVTAAAMQMGGWPLLSPDGRWLTLVSMDYAQRYVEIIDLDGETNWRVDSFGEPNSIALDLLEQPGLSNFPHWSPDGRWLTVSHAGVVHLFDPEQREQVALALPQAGCAGSAWLR
jgi:hypothetical protein